MQYPIPMKSIPGFSYKTPGVQIGQYISADCSDVSANICTRHIA
eukprot:SAG22_NODE_15818_length_339_cov_1.287500_1_plen_43_part_01